MIKTKQVKKRIFVYNKYGGRCAYCGCLIDLKKMTVDHIRPKRTYFMGDRNEIPEYLPDDLRNLNPSCFSCNVRKGTLIIEQFRQELEQQTTRLKRDSAPYRLCLKYGIITEDNSGVVFYFEKFEKETSEKNAIYR